MKQWRRGLLVAVLVVPGLALASIGKVTVLEGTAKRTNGTDSQPLAVGSEIELHDTIEVSADSNLKLMLTDESVLMLSSSSQLFIDEATFEGQERKGFVAKLGFGKVWARVKKALAGSDSKFEVKTERAVAGVRGTIFRVDYGETTMAILPAEKMPMVVRVVEGRVQVAAKVLKQVVPGRLATSRKGEHQQVSGPQEISKEQWEEKFANLQKNQQVRVGSSMEPEPLDKKAMKDEFGRFVDRNQ